MRNLAKDLIYGGFLFLRGILEGKGVSCSEYKYICDLLVMADVQC